MTNVLQCDVLDVYLNGAANVRLTSLKLHDQSSTPPSCHRDNDWLLKLVLRYRSNNPTLSMTLALMVHTAVYDSWGELLLFLLCLIVFVSRVIKNIFLVELLWTVWLIVIDRHCYTIFMFCRLATCYIISVDTSKLL